MSSTALKPQENLSQIRTLLTSNAVQHQIDIALGSALKLYVSPEKLVRVALTAIQGDYKLIQCDPVSIVGSVIQLAQVGLVPDGFLGQAYLVPFYNKRRSCYEATPIIGYRGFGELAVRSGKATSVDAHVIYAGDLFEFEYGSNPFLKYKMTLDPKKRGVPIGAFAMVYMKEGPHRFEIMSLEEIVEIQNQSKGRDSEDSPWKKYFAEMARKTPMRKLAKWVPLSPEFQLAAGIDELGEVGKSHSVLDDKTGEVFVLPEGTEAAPIERPKVVTGEVVIQPDKLTRTVVENAPLAYLCSCCKAGKCDCASKEPFDQCGCAACVSAYKNPVPDKSAEAKMGTAATLVNSAPPLEDIFGPDPNANQPKFVKSVAKLMAIARSVCHAKGISTPVEDWVHGMLKAKWGISSLKEIPQEKYNEVCTVIGETIMAK